jgi:hypothetical protein
MQTFQVTGLALKLSLHQFLSGSLVQELNRSAIAAGLPAVGKCEMSRDVLSEDAGTCGDNLITVYDFWSASNRTFPGMSMFPCP